MCRRLYQQIQINRYSLSQISIFTTTRASCSTSPGIGPGFGYSKLKQRLSTAKVTLNRPEDTNLNVRLELEARNKMDEFSPSATDKLRRFCYLGTFEAPVYAPTTFDLIVQSHIKALREVCNQLTEPQLVECLSSLLEANNAKNLPRRDEALLVLAFYMSTHIDDNNKTGFIKGTLVRKCFGEVVCSVKDLFMFVKFVKDVHKLSERNTPFSRTVRKSILEWYTKQPVERLLHMWSVNECQWNMHRELLNRCHYSANKIEMEDKEIAAALRLLTSPIKELVKWPKYLEPLVKCKDIILGIAKLRLVQNASLALPIIKQLSLSYDHVPNVVMTDLELINHLLPTMSYEQLLQSWPRFNKLYQRDRSAQRDYTEVFFDVAKLRAANVEPIRILLQEQRVAKDKKKVVTKGVVTTLQPSFVHDLYKRSFGCNKPLGLRLQIVLNLESCYISKSLTGRWRPIKYLDAVVALAFGYYQCDPEVVVQFWHDKSGQLKTLPWTPRMSVDEARACCQNQKVDKIKQSLTDVIENALNDTKDTYDVFLVIVPNAMRGNNKQHSDQLCQRLDEYRQKRNKNAKFIIMSLRQHHGSMSYSKIRNENILELCSISEQMPRLINAFARGHFF